MELAKLFLFNPEFFTLFRGELLRDRSLGWLTIRIVFEPFIFDFRERFKVLRKFGRRRIQVRLCPLDSLQLVGQAQ